MQITTLEKELSGCSYPGRGIVIGRSADGTKAVTAYFIMGRSANSRNRVFVEDKEGIRTEAFDPSKLEDPSLIIYAPVRVLGKKTIVTNGDQTDTVYDLMALLSYRVLKNSEASSWCVFDVVREYISNEIPNSLNDSFIKV